MRIEIKLQINLLREDLRKTKDISGAYPFIQNKKASTKLVVWFILIPLVKIRLVSGCKYGGDIICLRLNLP